MERNNGVPAIIYLAFVRNRTLQPYFRSASTDAIFHSLTTFTFTQTPHGLSVPFPARERCPSSWALFRETAKIGETKERKRRPSLITASSGLQRSPNMQVRGLRVSLRGDTGKLSVLGTSRELALPLRQGHWPPAPVQAAFPGAQAAG